VPPSKSSSLPGAGRVRRGASGGGAAGSIVAMPARLDRLGEPLRLNLVDPSRLSVDIAAGALVGALRGVVAAG
jgi:hypothetical protein